ncbi:MAG: FixH family protein [Ectobacillus sp.]
MKKLWIAIYFSVLLLAGCSGQNHNGHTNELPQEVKVEVQTKPETIKAHEKTEIQAIVTQDGNRVENADDVKFEIWKDGNENHETIEAKHKGNGVYFIEKEFGEDGIYHIIAHTNARDMHVMPEVKVTVGSAAPAEQASNEHGGHSAITIRTMAENLKVNIPAKLTAHIQENGAPLTGAKVQFEFWAAGSGKHEYVTAKEGNEGEYTGAPSFSRAGMYQLKVHVEKGSIHEHTEQTIEVE